MTVLEQIFLALAYLAAIGFLIGGLDDLFFDTHFLFYLWRARKRRNVSLQELRLAPEQWVALCVPAWQEGGVVNKMAEFAARVVLYEKYDLFIGVYPNDPETTRCVDEICAVNPRIHKVVVPHEGPTSKADCLNWIYRGMRLNEIPGAREYKIVAIHDAEDVIHPLVLKVYNYFVPSRYDMAQVPVFALELPVLKYWSGNTYIDDFVELHTKDMFIREELGGVVPSAGVGTCFTRQVLDKLAADNHGDPFRTGNLTEDYEIGIRVKRSGFRTGIPSYPVDRVVRRRQAGGRLGPPETVTEVVAIRESFPTTFRAAVRQRSRWILGISFQTWEQTGWAGTLPMRYTLLRDRRAPLTHFINMTGYLVLAYVLLEIGFKLSPWSDGLALRPLFDPDSWLWKIIIVDTCLLVYRALQKIISVQTIYNWKQALMSIPRLVIGNVINFVATLRAVRTYVAHRVTSKPLVWLKTPHVFPADNVLSEFTRTIEDLLVEDGLATREQIFQALKTAGTDSAPLSLLRLGLIDEKQFTEVWARHSGLGVRFVNPYDIPEGLLRQFPETQALQLEAIPVERQNGRLIMAFREPPAQELLDRLSQQLNATVLPNLARPSNIAFVRDRAYPRLLLPPSRLVIYLAEFKQSAALDSAAFLEVLGRQHATGRSLPDVIIEMGLVSAPQARRLWAQTLGCPESELEGRELDRQAYDKIGPAFWWLHRMLPLRDGKIVTATVPHPAAQRWLAEQLGREPAFVAELPDALQLAMRKLELGLDPDQVLLDSLVAKGWLKQGAVPDLTALRGLIADPIPKWLVLQKLVSEEQLHQTFLETFSLPAAAQWTPEEAQRLAPVLPPAFSAQSGCYCLQQSKGAIGLGLCQTPSAETLSRIYQRLLGYPIFFQALDLHDAEILQTQLAPAQT